VEITIQTGYPEHCQLAQIVAQYGLRPEGREHHVPAVGNRRAVQQHSIESGKLTATPFAYRICEVVISLCGYQWQPGYGERVVHTSKRMVPVLMVPVNLLTIGDLAALVRHGSPDVASTHDRGLPAGHPRRRPTYTSAHAPRLGNVIK